jgi:hypothetical protein
MIIFCRTRHDYDSYIDFWDLVRLCGFETRYIDEIDVEEDACFIFTPWNGEAEHLRGQLNRRKIGRVVYWRLERFDSNPRPYIDVIDQASELVDEIWVSDRWISTWDLRLKYVCFGSHPDFGATREEPRYDFTHQSYAWGRRDNLYAQLRHLGLREGPSSWGDERAEVLRHSRLMLNLQQYKDPVTAPIRFAVAAAFRLPTVSETIRDAHPVADLVACAPYRKIVKLVQQTLKINDGTLGDALHERLCHEWSFRKQVLGAV